MENIKPLLLVWWKRLFADRFVSFSQYDLDIAPPNEHGQSFPVSPGKT
jgi:hypothetical protein